MFESILSGKTFLITGASGGLGEALAQHFLEAGARLILQGNRRPASSFLKMDSVYTIQADLAIPEQGIALWKEALAWTGRIHGVINNAGIMIKADVESDYADWHDAWRRTLQVNLIAAADISYEAIRHFRQNGREGGIIINISSRAAHRGDGPAFSHYAASKAGMIGFAKTMARAYAADNILVYTIAPGFIDNEKTAQVIAERGLEAVVQDIPMGAPVPPVEIAKLAVFLASGTLRHASGSTFDMNGASYVR